MATAISATPIENSALSEAEKRQMCQCESVLQKGLATFFEVGGALLTIRENQLFRAECSTFEGYCRKRWGIGRSYAWRVIGAAERLRLLPSNGGLLKPTNEFQIRPFLKLEPDEFPQAWNEVLSRAKSGRVTPKLLTSVVEEMCRRKGNGHSQSKKLQRRGVNGNVPLGRALVLLHEIKLRIEKGESEQALAALDKLEAVLFRSRES